MITKNPYAQLIKQAKTLLPKTRLKLFLLSLFVLLLLGFTFWRFKHFFLVAVVNGQPITRWHLNQQLINRFGKSTLDELIGEAIITQETRRKGIFVNQKELDREIERIQGSLGNEQLAEVLNLQGLSEDDFRRQLQIKLLIDKMLADQVILSADDIDLYIKENKQLLSASDQAGMRQEAELILRQQQIQGLFQSWYQQVIQNSDIKRFL